MTSPIYSALMDDPDYAELVTEFVSKVPDRVHSIRQSIEANDSKQLCTLIHQLKGACGSYGFHEITPLADALEAEIRTGKDIYSMSDALEDFIHSCSRISAGPA